MLPNRAPIERRSMGWSLALLACPKWLCYCELWRCSMSDNVGSKVSFFIVGLGIGALIGILFAPKSGEETREYLTSKADEGRDYAQKKARELRERAEDLIERSKEIMARQKESLASAVDAGKDAYQREKSKAS
jgi:gas vesicle protein